MTSSFSTHVFITFIYLFNHPFYLSMIFIMSRIKLDATIIDHLYKIKSKMKKKKKTINVSKFYLLPIPRKKENNYIYIYMQIIEIDNWDLS